MSVMEPYRVKPDEPVRLADVDPGHTGAYTSRMDAEPVVERNLTRLRELQEVLYAEARRSVLVIFQAMDAGGKDGVINRIFSGLNPQGVQVTSFKAPTSEELAHDFLWRIHRNMPPKGHLGIFNRSHYEDVLIVRVHDLVPKEVWEKRYQHINHFEALLADSSTTILKFYLHISRHEQKKRLQARLSDPTKKWKFNPGDLPERQRWDEYMAAYQDALNRCSTPQAPWYVVPSNHKWYRDVVVSQVLVDTLEGLQMQFPSPPPGLDQIVIP